MVQLNKNIKIFLNYIVGPLLFCWLSWSLYQQVLHQPHLQASWTHIKNTWGSRGFFYLAVVGCLMVLNWGIESIKWRLAVKNIHHFRFIESFQAVMSGVSFSVVMPNRVGEYLGRMMFMPEGKKLKVVSAAIICSLSQLLITLIAGTFGLFFLKNQLINGGFLNSISWQWSFGIMLAISTVLTILYFNVGLLERLGEQAIRKRSWYYMLEVVKTFSVQRLGYLLGLSFARYLVFVIQYILIFSLFDVNVSPLNLLLVMTLVFLSLAVVPTIALAEIGLRGKISVLLVGLFSGNSLGIILATVVVWIINLIIPALVGTILMLRVRIFRIKQEE